MQAPVTTSAGWWSFSRTRDAAIQKANITGLKANFPRIGGISWGEKKNGDTTGDVMMGIDFMYSKYIITSTIDMIYYNQADQAYWDIDTPANCNLYHWFSSLFSDTPCHHDPPRDDPPSSWAAQN